MFKRVFNIFNLLSLLILLLTCLFVYQYNKVDTRIKNEIHQLMETIKSRDDFVFVVNSEDEHFFTINNINKTVYYDDQEIAKIESVSDNEIVTTKGSIPTSILPESYFYQDDVRISGSLYCAPGAGTFSSREYDTNAKQGAHDQYISKVISEYIGEDFEVESETSITIREIYDDSDELEYYIGTKNCFMLFGTQNPEYISMISKSFDACYPA